MTDDRSRQGTAPCEVAPGGRGVRIRDWKGLLHGFDPTAKRQAFLSLLIVSCAMTFTQLGFIGIGANGEYEGYVLGLLIPVSVTALLLGKGAGALQGLLSGAVLYVHSILQPLDIVERYFVSVLNSIVLYTCCGFLMGLLFACALRAGHRGGRTYFNIALACLVGSAFATLSFIINSILQVLSSAVMSAYNVGLTDVEEQNAYFAGIIRHWSDALDGLGSFGVQCLLDFLVLLVVAFLTYWLVRKREGVAELGLRASFSIQMFIVVSLVFCVLSAASFILITIQSKKTAVEDMDGEAEFIGDRLFERDDLVNEVAASPQIENLPLDVIQAVVDSSDAQSLIDGYDLETEGTFVVFDKHGYVWYSNSPAYPDYTDPVELLGTEGPDMLRQVSETGELREVLYDTSPYESGDVQEGSGAIGRIGTAELGYMRVVESGDYYIMVERPASSVFAGRNKTMGWSTMLAFSLCAAVYALSLRVLKRDVAEPIDRTNDSLARITAGDLETEVTEHGTAEFSSLSSGINTTVGALRNWIHEAETRMETELSTAKAIQESALPRVFPPFPEIDRFDIFASMDPAREVGGDFYDFFLIDDDTLGFLIADVSGKGIPGALFMMTAKTQIENYMSTGMELSQAIATANQSLCATNDAGMFVTVWAATLDIASGEVAYVNAGHNFPLLRHGAGGAWEWVKKKCGLFLGTFETAKYRTESLTLEPGDELILYTDGVSEAFNVGEEEYGNKRLEAFLAAHSDMHARELVRALRADVATWAEGAEQSDDVTIMVLEYGVAPEVTDSATFDAVPDGRDQACEFVGTELERRLCPVDVRRSVEMAVGALFDEACRNARTDADVPQTVQVTYVYNVEPSRITVEVRDEGCPIGSMGREDPGQANSLLGTRLRSLGVTMYATVMDGMQNVIVFKKDW